jgi:hypothetical protein
MLKETGTMKKILALTAGMLLVASLASAREIDTGTIELSGSSNGNLSYRSGDGTTENVLNLDLEGRYYLIPNLGVGGLFNYAIYAGDVDGSSVSIGGGAKYNFDLNEVLNAYAGADLGYSSSNYSAAADGAFLGVNGGIKYFFADAASLNSGLSFSYNFGDGGETHFGVNVGLSIYLE